MGLHPNEVVMVKPLFKSSIPVLSILLILLIFPVSAQAFPDFGDFYDEGGVSVAPGDMRVGRVKLHPGVAFESRYESNIFEEADQSTPPGTIPEGRTDDFIFTLKPSMRVELERAAGEIFGFYADYLGRDENYLGEGESQNFFNHRIGGGVNLGGPGGRGDVTIGGSWEKRAGGTNRDFNSNIGNRQINTTTAAFVDAVYALSKIFKLQLRADGEDTKYQGRKVENVDEYNFGGSLFWQATKLAAFGIKYNHRARRYEIPSPTNDDSDADQIFLAMRWEPTSLFLANIAVGFDTKRYENFKGDNSQNLVYQLDMDYRPVKRTRFHFEASREVIDSSFGFIQSYILSYLELRFSQKMGKKFTLLVDTSYDHRDYRRSAPDTTYGGVKTRIDHTVSGTTALVYEIQKWLDARASYQYEQNLSNFGRSNFKNNIGVVEVSAKF